MHHTQRTKLENLYMIYLDKLSIAKTMRNNLASDINAGYGLANVIRQMVKIEEYEATKVAKAYQIYQDYKCKVSTAETTFPWEYSNYYT